MLVFYYIYTEQQHLFHLSYYIMQYHAIPYNGNLTKDAIFEVA